MFSFDGECVSEDSHASVIKRTCPKRNKFGFPLTFSYRVNKKTKYDISDVMLWKNIKCVMLIMFFVHDTR